MGSVGLAVAVGSAGLGLGLWLIGARFSRPLLATAATIGGGAIGYESPHWFAWALDPWTVAVLGSLLFGVIGFLAYRWVAAIGLGLILSIWTILGAVAHAGLPNRLIASLLPTEFIWSQIAAAPKNLPSQLMMVLLVAGGIGLIGGTAVAIKWPRLGTALFWTILGLSIALGSILAAAQDYQPKALGMIPPHAEMQLAALGGLIVIGAAVQWRITFAKKPLWPGRKG